MIVLVTGAAGTLGRLVVAALAARAHAVRAMTSDPGAAFEAPAVPVLADLRTGHGVPDAVDGVGAIVHCATDSKTHRDGTRHLVETAVRSGVDHVVYPGIVGADVIPLRSLRASVAAEEMIASSGIGWTVLRSTQLHTFVWSMLERLARFPVLPVPASTRVQPIDPAAVAVRLADAVERGPSGRLADIGGPTAYEASELARSYLAAVGRRRRVVPLNIPGIAGAALRAGGNLTPNRAEDGRTWNEFVAEQMERVGTR